MLKQNYYLKINDNWCVRTLLQIPNKYEVFKLRYNRIKAIRFLLLLLLLLIG
jgi:hypothetical protein